MAAEANAEEIEDFALVEIGRRPDRVMLSIVGIYAIEPDARAGCAAFRLCERMW